MIQYVVAFPAYAGMFLAKPKLINTCSGFPRVCGDVSEQFGAMLIKAVRFPRVCGDVSDRYSGVPTYHQLSPRMRGCFYYLEYVVPESKAFPAYAGMFL